MSLFKKGDKTPPEKNSLNVPRYLTIIRKCAEYQIPDSAIVRSHFNDLYVLIMSLDIANIKQALRRQAAAKWKERGIQMRDISQADAVKFLKGG